MRIKTFTGRSIEELLPEIRAELGDGAVVIGQRTKVQGGVAGFFGTKVIEVTAADGMPSDAQLVDLEAQLMGDAGTEDGEQDSSSTSSENELAERFAGAMRMGRVGGLDVTDTWDPSQDAELAQEYGRVLEHAASAGFTELDVPAATATVPMTPPAAPAAAAPMPAPAPAAPLAEPMTAHAPIDQARALAARAHENMQHAAARMEATYAPPQPLPNPIPVEQRTSTFAASVQDTPMQGFDPQAVPSAGSAARTVDEALRSDLGLDLGMPSSREFNAALNDAVDILDLKAMAALRSAVHATRRSAEESTVDKRMRQAVADLEGQLAPISARLEDIGVDAEVIDSLVDTAVRHRLPFGGEQNISVLLQTLIAETIDIRSGFPNLGRAHRAAIVGAANAGKTTVVAKLARGYSEIGMRVGVLSIVASDPGVSLMADRSFKDLDVDVRYAATPEQALEAIDAFDEHELVLVDTPASTYLDADTFAQVQRCLTAIGIDDVHVVLPLATSSREARSVMDAFRPLGANRMIVSRIDESRYFGEILNFGFRLGVPMTFLSDGPDIAGDLTVASARDIARRILPTADDVA